MKRPLYVSTGALVGRVNGYDLRGALDIIAGLYAEGACRGMELMMLSAFCGRKEDVISSVRDCGVPVPVIHCDKDVGTLLSAAISSDQSPNAIMVDDSKVILTDGRATILKYNIGKEMDIKALLGLMRFLRTSAEDTKNFEQ